MSKLDSVRSSGATRDDTNSAFRRVLDNTPNQQLNEASIPFDVAEPNEPDQNDVDTIGFWLLAAQHFFSTWGDRSAEFAFPIYLIEIFTDTLLPASIYGFVTTAAGIFLSGTVGSQVDIRPRLSTIRVCILTQKLFASLCYVLFLVLFSQVSSMHANTKRLLLAAIAMCGCGLKLATIGMNVCVERDWVMTIVSSSTPTSDESPGFPEPNSTNVPQNEAEDRTLLRLNAALRRIDLICKLVAPLFVSLLTATIGYRLSTVVLLGMGLISAVFEFLFVRVVYAKFPALALSMPIPEVMGNHENRTLRSLPSVARAWVVQQAKDWAEFARHPIFISSVSISLLYFNVLSFNSPFISYLKSQTNFSDPLIAGMRGLCVVTGLFGTFLMPWVERRIGLIRTGSWAIWSEAATLIPTVLCLYLGVDERQRPLWNSALLFTGMALSRVGLWSFDLAQLTQLQKALAHHPRQNTFYALQFSLQSIFDLAHYGLTLGWNRPTDFRYAAAVSLGSVFVASILYAFGYARPLRGHLFHFDQLRSKVML